MSILKNFSGSVLSGKIVVLMLIFAGLLSCSRSQQGAPPQQRILEVIGFRAGLAPYSVSLRSTGEILSWEDVELKAPVAGNVLRIHFNEGQYIRRGATILEIDSRVWQAQKRGLEAQLESAHSELRRRERLFEVEGASQEMVDQSRVAVSDLEARIEELDVRIDLSVVRAPFSGRVGMRNFSPGAWLTQGEIITQLVQSDRLRVEFDIPSRYATLPRTGMEVRVIPSANGDTAVATIYAIQPQINPDSRSLRIRAEINNASGNFIPGDFAQVLLDIDSMEEALLIPAEAIIPELNTQVVFVGRNGTAQRQEIRTGTRTQNRVHVTSGLNPGDTILLTGLMEVRDGSDIRITELNQEAGQ
jgi:membrane fusion protein, multidrug efflux system